MQNIKRVLFFGWAAGIFTSGCLLFDWVQVRFHYLTYEAEGRKDTLILPHWPLLNSSLFISNDAFPLNKFCMALSLTECLIISCTIQSPNQGWLTRTGKKIGAQWKNTLCNMHDLTVDLKNHKCTKNNKLFSFSNTLTLRADGATECQHPWSAGRLMNKR